MSTKFNGVSYPVQRAAEAVYSSQGKLQVRALTDSYMANAGLIRQAMNDLGFDCVGGINSPYIWVDCRMDSWEFFDLLLTKAGVVTTPGAGFGPCGEGYFRLTAFGDAEKTRRAAEKTKLAIRALQK